VYEVSERVTAAIQKIGAEWQRQEQIHPLRARDRRHDLGVEQEVRAQHADNLELVVRVLLSRESVEDDRLADDARIAVECSLPERIAQHDDGRLAGCVFVGKKQPAVKGLGAEQVEEAQRRYQDDASLPIIT